MKYLEMTNEEAPFHARHRAAPSLARRTATTVALGTAGVLVAAVLGWFTAGEAGLTASADAPAGVLVPEPSSEPDWAEPAMRRTVDIARTPPPATEEPAAVPEVAAVVAPSAVPRPSAPEPRPEPSLAPARPAVPAVQQGAPCPAEGDTGVTRSGNPAVCTASPGNGRTRWRHA